MVLQAPPLACGTVAQARVRSSKDRARVAHSGSHRPATPLGGTRRARRAALLVVAVAVVASALTITVGSTSAACSACHTDRNAAETGSHPDVSCYSCHLDQGLWDWPAFKAHEMFVMYPGWVLGTLPDGPVDETNRDVCLGCHESVLQGTIERLGVRVNHATCAPSGSCDSCHSGVAHGDQVRWLREPVMEECVACHRAESGSDACDTCHRGKSETERLSTGPWQVTHGANWQQMHGMGSLRSCSVCHPQDYCVRCHGTQLPHSADFGAMHGNEAMAENASCGDCHDVAAFCEPCHGVPMPHADGFLTQHSGLATGYEDDSCLGLCHRIEDCAGCHVAHTHPGRTDGRLGTGPNGSIPNVVSP